MSKSATDIVEGEVQKVTFDAINGLAWTKLDVLVKETLKGDVKPGTLITVYLSGGYVSIADQDAVLGNGEDFKLVDKKDWKTTYIKQVVYGEEFQKAGKTNVFYLHANETKEDEMFPKGSYERISFKYGQMEVIKEHEKVRRANSDVNEGTPYETFTWDEIVKAAQAK